MKIDYEKILSDLTGIPLYRIKADSNGEYITKKGAIAAMQEAVRQSEVDNEQIKKYAEQWQNLRKQMDAFYEDDSDADLGTIGEAAAMAFGYL